MKRFIALFAILCLGLATGACATITNGTTQAINVESDPAGADCSLMRGGAQLGAVTTPATLTVKRATQTIHVRCRKDGYEEALVVMNSRFETASAGNVLMGGLIGVMVDASTGANSKYDPYVLVRMTALSAADQTAVAARAKATPAAASSPPEAKPAPQQAVAAVAAGAQAGPFDGVYRGGLALITGATGGLASASGSYLRTVEIRVTGGTAVGTVRYAQCAEAGELKLKIDSAGSVTGEGDMLTGSTCGAMPGILQGRAEGGRLLLTVTYNTRSTDFSLTRQ